MRLFRLLYLCHKRSSVTRGLVSQEVLCLRLSLYLFVFLCLYQCAREIVCVREGVKSLYVMMLFRASPQIPIRNTHTNMRTHTNINLSGSRRLTHPPEDRERDARAHAHTHTHTDSSPVPPMALVLFRDTLRACQKHTRSHSRTHTLSLTHTHTYTEIPNQSLQ